MFMPKYPVHSDVKFKDGNLTWTEEAKGWHNQGAWLNNALELDVFNSKDEKLKTLTHNLFAEIEETSSKIFKSPDRAKQTLKMLLINLWISNLMGVPVRYSRSRNDYVKDARYGQLFFKFDTLIPIIDILKELGYIEQKIGRSKYEDKNSGFHTRMWANFTLIGLFIKYQLITPSFFYKPELKELIILNREVEVKRKDNIAKVKTKKVETKYTDTNHIRQMRKDLEIYRDFLKEQFINVVITKEQSITYEFLFDLYKGILKGKNSIETVEYNYEDIDNSVSEVFKNSSLKELYDSRCDSKPFLINNINSIYTSKPYDIINNISIDTSKPLSIIDNNSIIDYSKPLSILNNNSILDYSKPYDITNNISIDTSKPYDIINYSINRHYPSLPSPITNMFPSKGASGKGLQRFNSFHNVWDFMWFLSQKYRELTVARRNNDDVLNEEFALTDIGIEQLQFSLNEEILYRVFNRKSFKKGGRAFGASYQRLPKLIRKGIRINNENTVELDYSAYHIRMLYHLNGIDYQEDPYTVCGGEKHRKAFKCASLVIINAKNETEAKSAIRNELIDSEIPLPDVKNPLNWMVDRFKEAHQPIAKFICSDYGVTLQNIDSNIMNDILMRLMSKGILGLSLFDSVICPARHEDFLREVMVEEYKKKMGFEPRF
jgi:hypothetical protein